jgi:hypothetical protein
MNVEGKTVTGRRWIFVPFWVWCPLLAVFVFYPLSSGPAWKLWEIGWLPSEGLTVFYAPLDVVGLYVPGVNETIRWYVHRLWRVGWVQTNSEVQ